MLKSLIVSIHLMLLFISPDDPGKQDPGKFQYISCYSLSWSLQLPVLHNYLVSIHLMLLFIFKLRSVHLVSFSFQYISCYSLSPIAYIIPIQISFNTSHVTLHPGDLIPFVPINLVSIHLMLLFICILIGVLLALAMFQYISCYSLSYASRTVYSMPYVSIHLMLLFIILNKCK